MRKRPLLACSVLAAMVAAALALSAAASAEAYRPGRHYEGGSVVEFEGRRYRAKWYANGDQSPAAVAIAANAWDTPWERVDAAAPVPPAPPAPTPTPAPGTGTGTGTGGDSYDAGSAYPAGCVVAYGGQRYRSKWYANPGQSPAAVATAPNPWDTPWERVDASVALGCADGAGPDPGGGSDPGTPAPGEYRIAHSQLQAREALLTDSPLMREVKRSIRTLANAEVDQVQPGRAANPQNVRRVESILDAQRFDHVFAVRNPAYTYRGFLQAIAKFPAICASYADGRDADAICRKTLATMIAHFGQETGGHDAGSAIAQWRQALVHVREMGWTESMRNGYNGECNPATWQGQA